MVVIWHEIPPPKPSDLLFPSPAAHLLHFFAKWQARDRGDRGECGQGQTVREDERVWRGERAIDVIRGGRRRQCETVEELARKRG